MKRDIKTLVVCLSGLALAVGCAGSSGSDGGSNSSSSSSSSGGLDKDAGATTTIAVAVAGGVTTPITVVGVVTALAGVPSDYPIWYVEDPGGGENSGVAVYCDPDLSSCSAASDPKATALHSLVVITGSLSKYMGQLELIPTAQTLLQASATPPPIAALTAVDLAPTGNSPYRGVFVKYDATKLTVDSVTPAALLDTDTACETPGSNGLLPDGGLPSCSPLCEPPIYSGFRANDGNGNEIYIEAPFFNTDPLQSSPECLSQTGVIPVRVGMTFTSIQGILDFDPYGQVQYLAPVQPSDYVTP